MYGYNNIPEMGKGYVCDYDSVQEKQEGCKWKGQIRDWEICF